MVLQDKLLYRWVHYFAPTPTGEDAVMACACGLQVLVLVSWDAAAQIVRRLGLARAGDVVQLTFNGQQGGGSNVGGTNDQYQAKWQIEQQALIKPYPSAAALST